MKKTMTRNIVIMAIVTVIMAVVLSLYIKSTGTVPAATTRLLWPTAPTPPVSRAA